ncbi:hypothetical protein D1816_01990 [Aquimarina sp. AD10]|uniref:hypothetical protein n=1 Tax=Aquimarina sp. AD10 TaxID=1714849 RepID=UPI000E53DF02|nr:hypothetical protein [Aquimarina sp. AD10]AXT59168.1 hypothetical protein D1816_01990 [Aquimarina sp. AD10]RKM93875.1 hypothetical protein D7033_19015 [Aquimarina sp. AD10]
MNKILKVQAILFLVFISGIQGQNYFEGQIEYKIDYEPINPNIPKNYLSTELGDTFTAFVKEDRYAMIYHGKGELGWMKIIVRLDQGYSYTEYEKKDTITKTKFGLEKEKLLEFNHNLDDQKKVLGELCESITINYQPLGSEAFFETFRGKYYFNPKYKLNPKLYESYTDGFWHLFVKESNSISIRNETEFFPLFKTIQEAISINEKEIPLKMFEPNSSKVIIEKK